MPESMPSLVRAMREAAAAVLEVLDAGQRHAVSGPFPSTEHREWTYLPGERPGLRLGLLTASQQGRVWDLVDTAYSTRGRADLALVVRLEEVRRELAAGPVEEPHVHAALVDPPYWLRFLGSPTDDCWAWRVSGHHLVTSATVVGDQVALTPQFFGAQPATVPSGPHAGFAPLPHEQDLARELVLSLQEDQRRLAVASAVAPPDIRTRFDPVVTGFEAGGLPRSGMDRAQAGLLDALVRQYLDRVPAAVADRAWSDLQDAGRDRVRFTWSGRLQRGAGHYHAVSGPTFLLEYDNTQEDANHIHSVWRDLRHDFGGDLLAAHHAAAHPPGPAGSVS